MSDPKRTARRGLAVYFGLVLLLSGGLEGAIMWLGGPIGDHGLLVAALMWSPTLAMVIARLALREGVRDVSFRLGLKNGGWKEWLLAWLYPVLVGGVAYGAAWLSGLAPFGTPEPFAEHGAALGFALSLGVHLTLVTLFAAITATGEELGWRGYMLTRLIDAGVPRPALVSGVIWALWHTPLILSGQYAAGENVVLSSGLFFVGVVAASYVFARVRMASGSVWPAVLAHSAWNAVIQGTFDGHVPGHDASHAGNLWVGESGILVAGANLLFAWLLTWSAFRLKRHPKDDESGEGSLRTL